MSVQGFIMSLMHGARGKEAAKALILPSIFGHASGAGETSVLVSIAGKLPLLLKNAVRKGIASLTQYGVVSQDGTPTPTAPVDIVCNNGAVKYGATGKNLIKLPTFDEMTSKGQVTGYWNIPIRLAPNTTYHLFTQYLNDYTSINKQIYVLVTANPSENKGYKTIAHKTSGIRNGTLETDDSGYLYLRVNAGVVRSVYDEMLENTEVQLETGDTATDYEPYVDGIIIDGTPEVLSVGGKNAFNAEITSGRSISAQGAITITPSRSATESGVPIIGGEDYVLSYAESFKNGVFFYGEDDKFISYLAWGNPPRAFTAPSDARFVRFSFYEATPPTNVQLELGSTATTYEPYRTPQTASVENLFAVDDYRDEQNIVSGTVTRRVGIKVLTGDEEWSTTTVGYYRIASTEHIPSALAVCTHLAGVSSGSIPATADREGTVWLGSNWIGLGLRTRFAAVADFKAWLADQYAAGTPVIVLYPLANEATEQVTPQPLATEKGDNVLSAISYAVPEADVEYYATESVAMLGAGNLLGVTETDGTDVTEGQEE